MLEGRESSEERKRQLRIMAAPTWIQHSFFDILFLRGFIELTLYAILSPFFSFSFFLQNKALFSVIVNYIVSRRIGFSVIYVFLSLS